MRIIFINLHKINFLLNTYDQIQSGWAVKTYKHKFFLDYLIKQEIEVINFISSDKEIGKEINEANYVYRENGYTKGVIKNIFKNKINEIKSTDILIVYFHYFQGYIISKKINCKKILFGNHFIRVKKGQYFNLKKDGFLAFINEVDVRENKFVKKFFNIEDIYVITFPYVFEKRFKNKMNFQKRKNKAMAIGTLSTTEGIEEYSGYRAYYKTNWVQPMRLEIIKKRRWIKKYIDSYISYIYENQMRIKKSDNKLVCWIKRKYNETHKQQEKYTSFDIVDKFNEYRMFICPEELAGVYGISVIEGMACGTAFIGINHQMYYSIGLIPGIHYISYNGTLKDLKNKIAYYQKHKLELEKIAKNGEEFVRSQFTAENVASKLFNKLKEISEETIK